MSRKKLPFPHEKADTPLYPRLERRILSELHPNAKNPRKATPEALARLKKSLSELGNLQPVVFNVRTGKLLGGHQRVKCLAEVGTKETDVWCVDLDERREGAAIIALNKSAGEWDNGMLKDLLQELDAGDIDMDITGFAGDEIETLMNQFKQEEERDAEPQIDKAEELNREWKVKVGDLWAVGDHRLLCGDSTKKEDVALVMGKDSATCVFTDPPYGVSIGKKNIMLQKFRKGGCRTSLAMDDMKPDELGAMLLSAFTILREFMADDCSVFVCSPQGGGLGMMMMMMMRDAGLEVRHILNWVKNHATFSMNRLDYDYQHEPILFTWKKTHKSRRAGVFQTSLWKVDKPSSSKEHPTMKPVELPVCAILNHTDESDVVVDIFGGSGTTMIAAENCKRRCRMVEKSPNFCAVILQRMKDAFPSIKIERVK